MKKQSVMAIGLVAALMIGVLPVGAAGLNNQQIVASGEVILDSERSADGLVSVNAQALPTTEENLFRVRLDVTTSEDLKEMTVKEGDAAVLIIVDKSTSMTHNGPIVQDTEGLAAVLEQYPELGLNAADLPLSTSYDKTLDQLVDVDTAVGAAYGALLPQVEEVQMDNVAAEENPDQPTEVYEVEDDTKLPAIGPGFTLDEILTQVRDSYHYRAWFERQAVIDFLDNYAGGITDDVSRYFALGTFHQDASIKADWSKLGSNWQDSSAVSKAALDYSHDTEAWTSNTQKGSALTYTKGSGTNVAGAYLLARNMMYVGFDPTVGYYREEGIEELHVILITDGEPSYRLRTPADVENPTLGFNVTLDDNGAIASYALKDNAKIKGTHVPGDLTETFDELRQVAAQVAQDDLFQLTAVRYGDDSEDSRESLFQDGGADYSDMYQEVSDTDLAELLMSVVFQETVPAISTKVYPWTVKLPMGQHMGYEGTYTEADAPADNAAAFADATLSWDLTQSKPVATADTETGKEYHYQYEFLTRLDNTQDGFVSESGYPVAGATVLDYQIKTQTEGETTFAADSLSFDVPQVQGYLAELLFHKVDESAAALAGATFGLNLGNRQWSAQSAADGTVRFMVPSGHDYTLTETQAPTGYTGSDASYDVSLSYGTLTIAQDGTLIQDLRVVNTAIPGEPQNPVLPEEPDGDDTTTDEPDTGTTIPDEDVPLVNQTPEQAPTTDILDEDAPLAGLTPEEEQIAQEEQEIIEEKVPLDASPKTNDVLGMWGPVCAVSGAALLWLALSGKKRRGDETN